MELWSLDSLFKEVAVFKGCQQFDFAAIQISAISDAISTLVAIGHQGTFCAPEEVIN